MRKYLFLIATAAIVASCADNDTLKKDIQNDEAISFESFTSKQTRAAENSTAAYEWAFFDHHESFKVWGFKNTSETAVFNGDVVTVTSDNNATPTYTYTYSPIRYWDKAASMYEYYAAAPSDGDWTFERNGLIAADITLTAGQDKAYFTTSSTLTGTNISTNTGDNAFGYVNSFKAANGDVDKLIADKKNVPYDLFKQAVQLDFIHILSRLNVTIKKDASLEPTGNANTQKVVMTNLQVLNLKSTGDFSEETAAVPAGQIERWDQDNLSGSVTYTAILGTDSPNDAAGTEVTKNARYVLQSLVIPQNAAFEIVALDGEEHASTPATYYATVEEYNAAKGLTGDDAKDASWWSAASANDKIKTPAGTTTVAAVSNNSKPYLVLTYTIQQTHDANGDPIDTADLLDPEEFTVYYNLANAFGLQSGNIPFYEGWQNTLNITIKPDRIEFCADVASWSTVERSIIVD